MNYLITGGAGFIGCTLTEALLSKNQRVCIIDDLSTGSVRNFQRFRENPNFSHHIDSILSTPLLAELVDDADIIIHLAAAVGVKLVVENPVDTLETNILGTRNILSLAKKKKKKVLIASTSEVYGKSNSIPFREEDDIVFGPTTKSRWSYACSKAIDEFLGLAYYRKDKLPVVIFRLFNTVGPRQVGHYGMVVPRFIKQALDGKPITVYGDGEQTRCFTFVGDAVWAIQRLALEEKAVGEIFNIGSSEEVSIKELAEKVRAKINPHLEIEFKPYEEVYEQGFEDMRRRVPCTDKIANLLGYRPVHTLDDILDKTIEYLRKEKEEHES